MITKTKNDNSNAANFFSLGNFDLLALMSKVMDFVMALFSSASSDSPPKRARQVDVLVQKPTSPSSNSSPTLATQAPIGLKNKGGNDCFIICLLQLASNSDSLANHICTAFPTLKPFIRSQQSQVAVDSQTFRKEMNKLVSKNVLNTQEDVEEYLRELLMKAPIYDTVDIESGREKTISPLITIHPDEEHLAEKIDRFMLRENAAFKTAPESLLIHVPRQGLTEKNNSSMKIDEGVVLTDALCRDQTSALYELTFVALHAGADRNGHYTSLIKKENTWYLANDSVITQLSQTEAEQKILLGSIFHFEKRESFSPAKPLAPIAAKESEIAPAATASSTEEPQSLPSYLNVAMGLSLVAIISTIAFATFGF